jgi:hypothetical protein
LENPFIFEEGEERELKPDEFCVELLNIIPRIHQSLQNNIIQTFEDK